MATFIMKGTDCYVALGNSDNRTCNIKGPAEFITYDLLHLPRIGLIQRYTLIFFVFFVSGCFHIILDLGASIPPSQSGAMKFFTM